MKRPQKIIRVKLDVDRYTEYILLGLVSSEPDYKLSLSLNSKLGLSLKNIPVLKLNGEDESFSRFSSIQDDEIIFTLIANRSGKNFFLNKLKNIDYLLQIQVSPSEFDIESITSALRQIESVTAVFRIDKGTLKDKNLHYLSH